nr:hypothetical protein CFP56_00970 [Quercus suber]
MMVVLNPSARSKQEEKPPLFPQIPPYEIDDRSGNKIFHPKVQNHPVASPRLASPARSWPGAFRAPRHVHPDVANVHLEASPCSRRPTPDVERTGNGISYAIGRKKKNFPSEKRAPVIDPICIHFPRHEQKAGACLIANKSRVTNNGR